MGWKSCMMCCGAKNNAKEDMQNIIKQEEVKEFDEQYVFLEQFPTNKRVENPEYLPAVSQPSSEENIQDVPEESKSSQLTTLGDAEKNVPFIGELPVPMDTGRVVELEGAVLPYATRFSLNLACGSTPTADLAFHFNPRFDQNYVARNSRFSGRWGHEESSSPLKNPFQRGKKFSLTILAAEEEFMIAVNGFHFCSYAYRTMRLKILTVQINGDVTVDSIEYRMVEKYPEIMANLKDPTVNITPENPLSESVTDKVELPLIVKLPSGINIGQQIEIVGRTKLLPHSFYVNLQSDVFLWPHPDILLHINPRFRSNTLVLNSWLKSTWGAEQSCPLLFKPGRPFSLKIKCSVDEFNVYHDGVAIGSYHYRASPCLIKAMYFQGDVLIKEITLN